MDCCYVDDDGCETYSVRPILALPCAPRKCCEEVPVCYPNLPPCPKTYCCEKPKKKAPPRTPAYCDLRNQCCPSRDTSPKPRRRDSDRERESSPCCYPPPRCESCCYPPCKPVKTKYVIPCYRYEDGRITNQPTVLMRRACEVAIGARPRRKPFVESCFMADSEHEESRYISEDERGNCCYHFEKKRKSDKPTIPCLQCHSSPECQYVEARFINPPTCCFSF